MDNEINPNPLDTVVWTIGNRKTRKVTIMAWLEVDEDLDGVRRARIKVTSDQRIVVQPEANNTISILTAKAIPYES